MNKTINASMGLANVIIDRLQLTNCIKRGKHDKAIMHILSCVITHMHKPKLSEEYGEMLFSSLPDDAKLELHQLEQRIIDHMDKLDNYLGNGEEK